MTLNPSYYQTAPAVSVSSLVQYQEHLFHLYAHDRYGVNDLIIVPEKNPHNHYGQTNVCDWDIRDGPDTNTAKGVARLQGLGLYADNSSSQKCYMAFNMVFTHQSFKGSTISVQGVLGPPVMPDEGEWAVVGGTGQFAFAQGTVGYKRLQAVNRTLSTIELQIRVVCLTFPKPGSVQKVGPWGGNGGTAYEIQQPDQLPQRLENITIYGTPGVIGSIEFSYIDQAGQKQKQTIGQWGGITSTAPTGAIGTGTGTFNYKPIQLGSTEVVQELYGATGDNGGRTVVTELTIVTNVTTYGPYGKQNWGNTPFHVAAPDGQSIVGFYGRADGQVVNQIGAYVGPNK